MLQKSFHHLHKDILWDMNFSALKRLGFSFLLFFSQFKAKKSQNPDIFAAASHSGATTLQ